MPFKAGMYNGGRIVYSHRPCDSSRAISNLTRSCNVMPSLFPGMDPYLEHPDFWPEVHHWLITLIAEALVPQVRPKYRVAIEKRIYEVSQPGDSSNGHALLVGIPDVSVHRQSSQQKSATQPATAVAQPQTVTLPMPEQVKQGYLEIRELQTGQVVTAIEVLSPVNKRAGNGRKTYLRKRQRILSSLTHLVEIDLLRGWEPMPILGPSAVGDYRVLISHSGHRPRAAWYTVDVTEPLPALPIPLLGPDEVAIVNLQALLSAVYDRGGFDYVVDYSRDLTPALSDDKAQWVKQQLKKRQNSE